MMLNSLIEESLILPILEKLVSYVKKIGESVKVQIKKAKAALTRNILLMLKSKTTDIKQKHVLTR